MQPAARFIEQDASTHYWTDGTAVHWKQYMLKGADPATFQHFPGSWAKDHKHCYWGNTQLKGADPVSFEALNFTYAKDKTYVWTQAGRITDADASSFVVCDGGRLPMGAYTQKIGDQLVSCDLFAPYGFAKDANKVYYYDFRGKAKVVNKADASSFVSLDDGYFGFDQTQVFCGASLLPKAQTKNWQKLHQHYYYSRSEAHIYYLNRLIPGADAETFEVVVIGSLPAPVQLAKDKFRFYWNDALCFKEKFDELCGKHSKTDSI